MKVFKAFKSAALIAGVLALVSCSAVDAEFGENEIESSRAAVTVVTSESALRSAINNASPGDTIKLGCNIKLTSQLQLLKSGTASNKINFNGCGYTLDCSGISSGWGVKVNGSY